MSSGTTTTPRPLKTVTSAVQCLLALAGEVDGLSLTQLARAIGSNKATVHRIVATLRHFDLVSAGARADKLRLGPRCAVFGAPPPLAHLCELARPYLRWLRDEAGETACLHVRFGYERACVEQVESSTELKWVAQIGKRFPLTAGAPGKAIIAFLPTAERTRVLDVVPLVRLAPESITDRRKFERVLAQVRRQGYATARNENVPGSAACAAPVYDAGGRVIATVTVAGAADRLTRSRLRAISPLVLKAAARLSKDLAR
jgi:DNA-binding IclR family transcriptional regulator